MESAWDALPDNLWAAVFSRVEPQGDLPACRGVCGSWRVHGTASVRALKPRFIFTYMMGIWRGVTVLDLSRLDQTSLSHIEDYDWSHRTLSGLRSIDFAGRANAGCLERLRRVTGLTELNLRGSEVHANALQWLRCLTCLTKLDLSSTSIGEDELEEVGEIVSLEELNLDNCPYLSDAAMLQLCSLTNCPLTGLTKLVLGCCLAVTDVGVVELARSMPHLRELDLNGLWDVTDAGVIAIAGLANLTRLGLGSTYRMTPVGLRALCTRLTALTHLDLHRCGCSDVRPAPDGLNPILDEHLAWFPACLPGLKSLTLSKMGTQRIEADGSRGWMHDDQPTVTDAAIQRLRVAMSGCDFDVPRPPRAYYDP